MKHALIRTNVDMQEGPKQPDYGAPRDVFDAWVEARNAFEKTRKWVWIAEVVDPSKLARDRFEILARFEGTDSKQPREDHDKVVAEALAWISTNHAETIEHITIERD